MTSVTTGGPDKPDAAVLRRLVQIASDREVQRISAEFARSCTAAYPFLRAAVSQGGQLVRRIASVWLS